MIERQFSSLYLDDAAFGVDILLVREINQSLELTPVDLAPEYVRGLMNLRSQIITVLDLGIRLGFGPRTLAGHSRCIVLKTNSELNGSLNLEEATHDDVVGLLVDRVGDIVNVDSTQIAPPPANVGKVERRFISGVIQLEDQLLSTLKISEILS